MSELQEEIPRNSAFHPDNVAAVSLITLLHIKDYLAILAGTANEKATDFAESLHEQGKFLCPPPVGGATSDPAGEAKEESSSSGPVEKESLLGPAFDQL